MQKNVIFIFVLLACVNNAYPANEIIEFTNTGDLPTSIIVRHYYDAYGKSINGNVTISFSEYLGKGVRHDL